MRGTNLPLQFLAANEKREALPIPRSSIYMKAKTEPILQTRNKNMDTETREKCLPYVLLERILSNRKKKKISTVLMINILCLNFLF